MPKKKEPKEIWACDFETTTDPLDCRVWAWGASFVSDSSIKEYGNSIDGFIEWCKQKTRKLYFHNLAFDGEFIVSWLLSNGYEYSDKPKTGCFKTIISNTGLWYSIEIWWKYSIYRSTKTTIWDSFKLIPFSIEKIAHDFNLPIRKLKLDYKEKREIGHELTPHEVDYLFNDIDIEGMALNECFKLGFNKMTATSCSFETFKKSLPMAFEKIFPPLEMNVDSDLRPAYSGGFVWVNPELKEKEIDQGIVFDVNSLIPSRMYYELLPYDTPIYFEGEYQQDDEYPLWVGVVSFAFDIKKDHIPCISLDKFSRFFGSKKYVDSSKGDIVRMTVTSVDWELFNEQYDVYDVEFINGYKFRGCVGIARQFIDEQMEVKKNSKGAQRFIAKRQLNSVYGKFATNPNVTPKIPFIDKDDGVLRLHDPMFTTYVDGEVKEVIDEQFRDPIYLPYGEFVTAYSRKYTISTAQKVGIHRVAYIDTDSIHLVGTQVPDAIKDIIDDKELGYWGLESVFNRSYFIGAKSYVEEIEISYKDYVEHQQEFISENDCKDKLYYIRAGVCYYLNVKCAGMTQKAKQNVTYDNFRVGNVINDCLKKTRVPGGIVLVDRQFSIKSR